MPYATAAVSPDPTPYQYPINTINNIESSVTEPPIGRLKSLINDVTVASAMAIAENTSCFAPILLFLPNMAQPANSIAIMMITSAVKPASVRLYTPSVLL